MRSRSATSSGSIARPQRPSLPSFALRLVNGVINHALGPHRADDRRTEMDQRTRGGGWGSHPAVGGLRIDKPLAFAWRTASALPTAASTGAQFLWALSAGHRDSSHELEGTEFAGGRYDGGARRFLPQPRHVGAWFTPRRPLNQDILPEPFTLDRQSPPATFAVGPRSPPQNAATERGASLATVVAAGGFHEEDCTFRRALPVSRR